MTHASRGARIAVLAFGGLTPAAATATPADAAEAPGRRRALRRRRRGRARRLRDPDSQGPLTSGIDLCARDREDLVAFLRSLTDRTVTTDPKVSDPFRGTP